MILAIIRSHNEIALAFASSGIAVTLLEGSRTAHSALKSLLNIQSNQTPTCNILKNSAMAKILQQCKLIVWDVCTMAHKKIFGELHRTMKDPRSTPVEELNTCLTFDRFRFFLLLSGEGSYKRNK